MIKFVVCVVVFPLVQNKNTQSSIKYILLNVKRTNEPNKNTLYLLLINNGIIMENTALNGTTVTKDHQGWKTKKGYGPIIVAVSLALLLGVSFYAGRHSDAMRMTNGVTSSSSSSLSLVGSGTTTSLSKSTCTKDTDCYANDCHRCADICHTLDYPCTMIDIVCEENCARDHPHFPHGKHKCERACAKNQ